MIYSVDPNIYPDESKFIEEVKYKDENDFEWRIARINSGFFVRYFGDEYFKDSTFECELKNGKTIRIKNTGCILFQDSTFESFCDMRNILKNGYTDDIWEIIESLFTERFEHDLGMIESEIII